LVGLPFCVLSIGNRILGEGIVMTKAACVECGGEIDRPADALLTEMLRCPSRGTELEMAKPYRVGVDHAPQIAQCWGG
jgi:hypothetical protein